MGKYLDYLKETDLFFNLTTTQLELVESLCEERVYQDSEQVIAESTREKELYLILKGEVIIYINPGLVASIPGITTKPQIIATLGRGQSFGEVALVDEGVRSASVSASGKDVRLLRIQRDRLMLLCTTYPELGFRIMVNLATDLAAKIRNTDLKLREIILYQKQAADK
jgi:CRP/FNR family cyclic AMP-dependent transcriptional regulator